MKNGNEIILRRWDVNWISISPTRAILVESHTYKLLKSIHIVDKTISRKALSCFIFDTMCESSSKRAFEYVTSMIKFLNMFPRTIHTKFWALCISSHRTFPKSSWHFGEDFWRGLPFGYLPKRTTYISYLARDTFLPKTFICITHPAKALRMHNHYESTVCKDKISMFATYYMHTHPLKTWNCPKSNS